MSKASCALKLLIFNRPRSRTKAIQGKSHWFPPPSVSAHVHVERQGAATKDRRKCRVLNLNLPMDEDAAAE
jgi:hypothetical protein